ncbi:MAG TPA: DNA methyltransferase, partial [Polyangiales bacterium]
SRLAMEANSWLSLSEQDPRHLLPDDLRARDAFGARDVGWVEQMRPFVRELSAPGARVLDPFAGFGTTLVAAALEGRSSLGIELSPERAQIARERLARLGLGQAEVMAGDVIERVEQLSEIDLVLTNLPYFGCDFGAPDEGGRQLYAAPSYAAYLEHMRGVFRALKPALRSGAHLVAMVQNVEVAGHFVPQAWDIARLLSERFTLQEERVLVYPRARRSQRPATRANRAHEYALVAVNAAQPIDIEDSLACVRQLSALGPCVVFGSFARWLRTRPGAARPADLDLRISADSVALARTCAWLSDQGFRLERWGAEVSLAGLAPAAHGSHYIRARRLTADGRLVQLDLCFGQDDVGFELALRDSDPIAGVRVARLESC